MKKWVVTDETGEARPELGEVEVGTKREALREIRKIMQDGDDTYNYVLIGGEIMQFESLDGYIGEPDPTDQMLQNPTRWDASKAVRVWNVEEAKMRRWDENYPENADIESASDGELFKMAREADDPDFSFACLRDLAWRHELPWEEDEELYLTYNRLNAALNEVSRYEYPYELDDKIMGHGNKVLLKWAEEADSWDEFSLGCLHEIAWRNDYGWHAMNEHMEEEDGDEAFARIKAAMEKEETKKFWYAYLSNGEDNDWGTGTFDRAEAEQWLREQGNEEAMVAVIDGGYDEDGKATTDPICVEEIRKEDL